MLHRIGQANTGGVQVESKRVDTSEKRMQMLSQALAAATDVYKENTRIMALLDDKAQKTAGLAGVFLAAAFAFLRRESIEDLRAAGGAFGMVLLGAALLLFLGCLFLSGLVMWARRLQLPPDPNKILAVCDALLADQSGPTDEVHENHIRDQIKSWNRANQVQDQVISDKSEKLLLTQKFLIWGIIAVAGLLALVAFGSGSPGKPPGGIQLIPAGGGIHGKMRSVRQRCLTGQQSVQRSRPGWQGRDLYPGTSGCAGQA